MEKFLFAVSSLREYPDSGETYFGTDSVHETRELAEEAIDNDMDDTLKDLDDERDDCKVDRQNFRLQAGSKMFTWRIDPVPNPLYREGG